MNQIGTFYVKVGKMGSELEELMKVEAMLEAATVFLVFTKAEGRWPFRIDNNADEEVVVWQKVIYSGRSNLITYTIFHVSELQKPLPCAKTFY